MAGPGSPLDPFEPTAVSMTFLCLKYHIMKGLGHTLQFLHSLEASEISFHHSCPSNIYFRMKAATEFSAFALIFFFSMFNFKAIAFHSLNCMETWLLCVSRPVQL